jgi:hypothetical protein
MRINVYNEELTDRIELHEKKAQNTGAKFYGLHFYLQFSRAIASWGKRRRYQRRHNLGRFAQETAGTVGEGN